MDNADFCGSAIQSKIANLLIRIFRTSSAKIASDAKSVQSKEKECETMSTNNSNHLVNPQAREAMDRFKMEAAAQVGVNLKNGYNGELTSRQAGSIGGQMVRK